LIFLKIIESGLEGYEKATSLRVTVPVLLESSLSPPTGATCGFLSMSSKTRTPAPRPDARKKHEAREEKLAREPKGGDAWGKKS